MIYNPREFAAIRNAALTVSGLAWILLIIDPGRAAMHLHGHAANVDVTSLWMRQAADWLLMLAAMMAPALIPSIYHIRVSSFARRRGRSTFLFLGGYAGVWLAVGGILLTTIMEVLRARTLAATTLALAVVWQCSPFKQACLNRCHEQTPLAAFGAAADWSALRFGAQHGIWCVGSCWLLMLLPMLLPQAHLAAMASISVLIYCERLEHPKPRQWQWRGFGRGLRILVTRANMLARTNHV